MFTGVVPVPTPRFHCLVRNVVFVTSTYTGHGQVRAPYNQQRREKAMERLLRIFPRDFSSKPQICRGHNTY